MNPLSGGGTAGGCGAGSPGICFAGSLIVLHLVRRAPSPPRLPQRPLGLLRQLAASAVLHATLVVVAVAVKGAVAPAIDLRRQGRTSEQREPMQLVFLAPESPPTGGGGGGGGRQQPGNVRRAQGAGSDAITLPTRKPPPAAAPVATVSPHAEEDAVPTVVLDAKPLASGIFDRPGLPSAVLSGTSTGPGSGGGVGTGVGTGIGSGDGPGLGAGSGGGTGGGVYRPGGSVTAPRLITEVKPRYTSEALRNGIQGTVVLEVIVASDGRPSHIRVVRSLDRGGLDEEAVAAAAKWRFEPGRLAGAPVDVLVTIMLDFSIR